MWCVIQLEGWLATVRHNQTESDLKDYGKKYSAVEVDWLSWVFVSATGGATHADRIAACPNVGEFPLSNFRDNPVGGQVLRPESQSQSKSQL